MIASPTTRPDPPQVSVVKALASALATVNLPRAARGRIPPSASPRRPRLYLVVFLCLGAWRASATRDRKPNRSSRCPPIRRHLLCTTLLSSWQARPSASQLSVSSNAGLWLGLRIVNENLHRSSSHRPGAGLPLAGLMSADSALCAGCFSSSGAFLAL